MSKKISVAIVVAFSFICQALSADYCGNFPERGFGGPNNQPYTAIYRSCSHGFSISIPHNLIAYGDRAPLPDHGVGIVLSWEPRSYIYAEADYNSLLYESLETAKSDRIRWITKDSISVVSVKDFPTVIDKIKSIRFVVRHTCPNLNGIYVDDHILAFRPDEGILYTISLLTTENKYSTDKLILEKIARSLKMDEIK